MEARGPFDRVLGSAGHFVLPGFVNCHYHCELAIGPDACTARPLRYGVGRNSAPWSSPTCPSSTGPGTRHRSSRPTSTTPGARPTPRAFHDHGTSAATGDANVP